MLQLLGASFKGVPPAKPAQEQLGNIGFFKSSHKSFRWTELPPDLPRGPPRASAGHSIGAPTRLSSRASTSACTSAVPACSVASKGFLSKGCCVQNCYKKSPLGNIAFFKVPPRAPTRFCSRAFTRLPTGALAGAPTGPSARAVTRASAGASTGAPTRVSSRAPTRACTSAVPACPVGWRGFLSKGCCLRNWHTKSPLGNIASQSDQTGN
jgi:hypothetical protein